MANKLLVFEKCVNLRFIAIVFCFAAMLVSCDLKFDQESESSAKESESANHCKSDLVRGDAALRLSSKDQTNAQEQALIVGDLIVKELDQNLVASGLSIEQAQFISAAAQQNMSDIIGGSSLIIDTNPIADVIAPIVQGAFFALTDPCASLNESDNRVRVAGSVMSSLTGSLSGRTSGLEEKAVQSVVRSMSGTAVESLGKAGLVGDSTPKVVYAIVQSTVGALLTSGIEEQSLASFAENVALGAMKGLGKAGVPVDQLTELAGTVASSAISGLVETGLSTEAIMQSGSIAAIVSGCVAGLSDAGIAKNDLSVAIGSLTVSAIDSFDSLSVNSADLKTILIVFVISGAMEGAAELVGNDPALLRESVQVVLTESVKSLQSAGFEAGEVSSTIGSVIEQSISALADIGITDSTLVSSLATDIIEGALAGASSIESTGFINETQLRSTASQANESAVEGFAQLKSDGVITSDAAVQEFNSTITSTIVSGLRSGGADESVVANVQADDVASTTGPTASLGTPSSTTITNGGVSNISLTLTASASGATALTGTLTSSGGGISVMNVTGNASCTLSVTNISTTGATISLNSCTGNGTLTLKANAGICKDSNNNLSTASNDSAVITVNISTVSIYVPNSGNNTITVHSRTGTLLRTITDASLNNPVAVEVDSSGNVYVVNQGDNKIIKFGPTGNTPLLTFLVQTTPYDVSLDSAGTMYVSGSGKLNQYSATGTEIRSITSGVSGPWGAAVNPVSGKIFASMNRSNAEAVYVYDATGTAWSSRISHVGLDYPYSIAFDSSGNFYTANRGPNTITKYSSSGTLAFTITPTLPDGTACAYGTCSIVGVAVDSEGNIYIADRKNCAVTEFASDGVTKNSVLTTGLSCLTTSGLFGIAVR